MTMPWLCFICASDQHNCGHREPDLIHWARSMAVRISGTKVLVEDAPRVAVILRKKEAA